MGKRPLSLTIIAWFLLISALFSIYSVATVKSNPIAMKMIEQMHVSLLFQQVMSGFGFIVLVACAYGIFKGQPWSRVLYTGWGIIGGIVGFITSPMKLVMLFGLLFFAVIVFFLFRPAANGWFAAKGLQLQRGDA